MNLHIKSSLFKSLMPGQRTQMFPKPAMFYSRFAEGVRCMCKSSLGSRKSTTQDFMRGVSFHLQLSLGVLKQHYLVQRYHWNLDLILLDFLRSLGEETHG